MVDKGILQKILEKIKKDYEAQAMWDLYYMCYELIGSDANYVSKYLIELSDICEQVLGRGDMPIETMRSLFDLHHRVCDLGARESFHLFLLATEWERDPDKKFYAPRKKVLRQVVDALQDLEDDLLDLLAVSLPPGTGKTTLAIFYIVWLGLRHPTEPILTGSHSNSFIRGVYDECLRVLQSEEYMTKRLFPEVSVVNTNAKDCRIDLGKRKRFETLEFTSIGTGNAGLYRASKLLYCDDLVSGLEVALSNDRLEKLWQTYTTDLRQRKIGDHCKELHIATRWSVNDVIGRLEEMYGEDERSRFIVIPALDENDESNFDYAYGVGFTTKVLREQRSVMEVANWDALYMNRPIEREGLLYPIQSLRRYYELPSGDPDAIVSICDTKDRGKDYAFLPVAYVYGQDYYIDACICDDRLPEIIDERIISILLEHKVNACRFESNSAGGRIADKVNSEVKTRGGNTHITKKYTCENKETKIIVHSDFVKQRFLFKDDSLYTRNSDYGKMMHFLCSYTHSGKNKHDDVPDGMAMLSDFVQGLGGTQVKIFKRPF